MSTRELVVLGTASQVPTRYRNHNGYFLRWDDEGFLFDPGEGTQRQMIHADVPALAITRVCITHFHGDHCLGLAGVSQRLSLDGAPHLVHAYYPASGQVFFERLRHASIYHDRARWQTHPIQIEGVIDQSPAWTLTALHLNHEVDCVGYRLQERDQRTVLPARLAEHGIVGPMIARLVADERLVIGQRVVTLDEVSAPRPGQSVAFVMDTRLCDAAVELARGVDLLVCESTFLSADADKAQAYGHLTAAQAASIARQAGVGRLVLTHFSQRYPDPQAFVDEAAPIFADVVAVKDGDVVAMPRQVRAA